MTTTMIQRTVLYRVFLSILFGLLGFAVNFIDIQLIDSNLFKVSILLGLIFPLLVALAWGWRYGLLSALAGGCQAMWWLWRSDGYGFLYAVPVFTLWVVWHGYWADRREAFDKPPWYYSVFIVEIPFRILIEIGFFYDFPVACSSKSTLLGSLYYMECCITRLGYFGSHKAYSSSLFATVVSPCSSSPIMYTPTVSINMAPSSSYNQCNLRFFSAY